MRYKLKKLPEPIVLSHPEIGYYRDMVCSIPHASRKDISQWLDQWVYYQSEEAYKRLVEQHVEKAIIIAIQLSLKHETDMEMTIEEALITLSEYT